MLPLSVCCRVHFCRPFSTMVSTTFWQPHNTSQLTTATLHNLMSAIKNLTMQYISLSLNMYMYSHALSLSLFLLCVSSFKWEQLLFLCRSFFLLIYFATSNGLKFNSIFRIILCTLLKRTIHFLETAPVKTSCNRNSSDSVIITMKK